MRKILLLTALISFTFLTAQITIFEDDFESYNDFDIDPIGGWTQHDVDGNTTYGSNSIDFLNEGYTGTAIIFNPTTTTPVAAAEWNPYGGNKGLYFFAATNNPNGTAANDDYFISPQIDLAGATGSSLSFWSKTLTDQWGSERYEVLISTTGTAIADFSDIGGGEQQAPITYTETVIDLSAYDGQQVYIALRYKGSDTFVWQVDNFVVSAQTVANTNENILANQVSIYPTTVANNFTIKNSSDLALVSATIFDVNGRLIASHNLNNLVGEKTINIANLTAGMYFVEIQSANNKLVKKIIKK